MSSMSTPPILPRWKWQELACLLVEVFVVRVLLDQAFCRDLDRMLALAGHAFEEDLAFLLGYHSERGCVSRAQAP